MKWKVIFTLIKKIIDTIKVNNLTYSYEHLENILNQPDISYKKFKIECQVFFENYRKEAKAKQFYPKEVHQVLQKLFFQLALELNSQSPHIIMMPELMDITDTFGNTFQDMHYNDFIITQKGNFFIHLGDFFNPLWERIKNGEDDVLVYLDENCKVTKLSPSEQYAIILRIPDAEEFFEIISKKTFKKEERKTVLDKLQDLRKGLMEGDRFHHGQELEAGSEGHVAIAEFYDYFYSLSHERKTKLKNCLSKSDNNAVSFRRVLDRLFKPLKLAKRNDREFCLAGIGVDLDNIIKNNIELLRSMDVDEDFDELKYIYKYIEKHIRDKIWSAIVRDDLIQFKWLCEQNGIHLNSVINLLDINSKETYLHICATYSSLKVAKYLLKQTNVEVNCCNENGETPLYIVSERGDVKMFKLLLQHKASIYKKRNDHRNPLYTACEEGHVEIVELLKSAGENVYKKFHNGCTPLYIASENGHVKTVQKLISYGANVNHHSNGLTAVFIASRNGFTSTVKVLYQHGADINESFDKDCHFTGTPLIAASEFNYLKTVKALVKRGAKINKRDKKDDYTPLYIAAYNGLYKVALFLLNQGASIDFVKSEIEFTELYAAVDMGQTHLVELLIQHGADVNYITKEQDSLLMMAVDKQYFDVVKLLVKNGANINAYCNGETALIIALENNDVEIAEYLIRHGADVYQTDSYKRSPLHVACQYGILSIVNLLIEKGVDINSCDKGGRSPLYLASEANEEKIVSILISRGANIKSTTKDLSFPLYIACLVGHHQIVQTLITAGEDVTRPYFNVKTNEHHSLLYLAMYLSKGDVVSVLIDKYLERFNLFDINQSTYFFDVKSAVISFTNENLSKLFEPAAKVFIKRYSNPNDNLLDKNITCFERLLTVLSWNTRHEYFFNMLLKIIKMNILKELSDKPISLTREKHEKIKHILNSNRGVIPHFFSTKSLKCYKKIIDEKNVIIESRATALMRKII